MTPVSGAQESVRCCGPSGSLSPPLSGSSDELHLLSLPHLPIINYPARPGTDVTWRHRAAGGGGPDNFSRCQRCACPVGAARPRAAGLVPGISGRSVPRPAVCPAGRAAGAGRLGGRCADFVTHRRRGHCSRTVIGCRAGGGGA